MVTLLQDGGDGEQKGFGKLSEGRDKRRRELQYSGQEVTRQRYRGKGGLETIDVEGVETCLGGVIDRNESGLVGVEIQAVNR